MRKQWAALLLPFVFALPSSAQKLMGAAQYRDFLTSLDSSAVRWQAEVEAFQVESLNINFSLGKNIEGEKGIALKNLELLRKTIRVQLTHEQLSFDINLDGSLQDLSNMLTGIVNILPERRESVSWAQKFTDLSAEIAPLDLQFRNHVLAYAEQLQIQAERCRR